MEVLSKRPAHIDDDGQPDTSKFNGLQTTGREYRNLSEPEHGMGREIDIPITLRDGARLLCDVYRPTEEGQYPVLIAASPYPRQIQDLGAPTAIIEAGNSEFFVSRGYVHVIVSLRGTGGSDGEWTMFDDQEREDLYDMVEWAAAQPWSNGEIGMIGISYFAIAQIGAAAARPPHLKAIFPFEISSDLYEAAYHYGLFSSSFMTPWLTMIGVTAPQTEKEWRGHTANAARHLLHLPAVHRRVGNINGESAKSVLGLIMKLPYDADPWDDLWRTVAIDHQIRDSYWDERNALPLLDSVDIPIYVGCDWDNVGMHLPGTFTTWKALEGNPNLRMGMLPQGGTTWPWEAMHVEALAWYDRHLKGRDTGIDDGPPVRFWLPGDDEWHAAEQWPPPATHHEFGLGAEGALTADPGDGTREYLCLGTGLMRPKRAEKSDPPHALYWESEVLSEDLDMCGEIELRLTASATAADTAWIVALGDQAPDGDTDWITGGWQRASLREVDEAGSRPGAPLIPCRNPQAVPIGEAVEYRIPLIPNARRFAAGHRIRLMITSDDQSEDIPVFLGYRHSPVGTSTRNTVFSSSRLLLPVLVEAAADEASAGTTDTPNERTVR